MIIKKLPHWVLSNPNPSFFETEGGTVLEQTGILYKKVQELIEHYNGFVDEINNTIDEFIANTLADQEAFEIKINQIVHDFTTLVDTKIKSQDTQIKDAIDYMKTNLNASVKEMLNELVNSGELDETVHDTLLTMFETKELTIDFTYNETTESLDITGVVVAEGGNE